MTQTLPPTPQNSTSYLFRRWGNRWSQGITLLIWVNVLMVIFNITYVALRPFYLQYAPRVTQYYDAVKGIEPQRFTQQYLGSIDELQSHVTETNTLAPSAQPVLEKLRQQSIVLVDENPFLASNQVASFARLKRRIQAETGAASAQAAFEQFWQRDRLNQQGWQQVDTVLETQLKPLLERNYFRASLPTGQYVDEFWRIDALFILFFGGELLVRTLVISRSKRGISWGDALVRRWYELPLLLPFARWLRIIPAAIRLHRTRLFDVERLLEQVTHEPAAYLSDRVSKYIMVRLINQAQTSVRDGKFLKSWQASDSYVTVGSSEKVDQILDRFLQIAIEKVMPTVQPDVEELLQHSLRRTLNNSQFYENLQQLPGLSVLPDELLNSLAEYLAQSAYDILADSYCDERGQVLMDQLSRDIRKALSKELRSSHHSEELQRLWVDLLEEVKLNYVQQAKQQNPEETLQEVNDLHAQIQSP